MPEDDKTYTWEQKWCALKRQILPYRSRLTSISTADVFVAAGNGVIPYLTGVFLDALVRPHTVMVPLVGAAPAWAALLGLWAVVQAVTNTIGVIADRRTRLLGIELEAGVQANSFSYLLTLPASFHKTRRAGEVTNIIDRSGWMVAELVRTALSIAPQLLTIIIGVGIAFMIRPSLAGVLLGGIALYLIALVRVLPYTAKLQIEGFNVWTEAYGKASDAYTNVYTVKQAGSEQFEQASIRGELIGKAVPTWYRMERAWSTMNAWQTATILLTQGGIFLYSVFLIAHGKLTIGELIAFNSYAGMIIGPFVSIGQQWQTAQNAFTTLAKLEEILSTPAEAYEPTDAEPLGALRGSVTFDHVHFAYDTDQPEVLSDVSFAIEPGQSVALVGGTGAGKSTTAELVSGYYRPTAGSITIDGHDLTRVNLHELRSQIAVVPQEVVLFNASITDNIRYGRPEATDEEVEQAAKRAHADAFIERFPKRYEQEVGERGIKLSVGQKQRLAIARAMLRDPRILILDEPTSALDAQTERYITSSLKELMQGRTTLIIAHRLSTVREADLILVLEGGKIAERGTHDELTAKQSGTYHKLYELHIGLHE